MKLVIMAGGGGTRLWPLSRRHIPKQSQTIVGDASMVQLTYRRLRRQWPARDIIVSTNDAQYPFLRKQLPGLGREQFILEPMRRDTSAAIGLVATVLHHRRPDEIMMTVNADHFIRQEKKYLQLLSSAETVVKKYPTQTLLIGTRPKFLDTGSGYFRVKRAIGAVAGKKIFIVERFEEKPDLPTAKRFFADPKYYVNTAWFAFRVDAMLEKYKRWLPASYCHLQAIERALGTPRAAAVVKREFSQMTKISIDYGIMEKDRAMISLPTDVEWVDIGCWQAVYDMLGKKADDNVTQTRHVGIDSRGNLLFSYSGKLIATAGLEHMVVVETDDAILVCPKHRSQDVRKIVTELETLKYHRHL